MGLLRYPLKQLARHLVLTALVFGIMIAALGWGRANPAWYNPFRTRELIEAKWIAPWKPLCDVKDSRPCTMDEEKCRCPVAEDEETGK